MAKVKIERDFGMIPNSLLYNSDISLTAKGLYGFIHAKPDDWDFSIERISKELKEGVKAIRSAVKELENSGWLTREKGKNSRGQWEVVYILHAKQKSHMPQTAHGFETEIGEEKSENHMPLSVDGEGANNKRYIKKYNNISKDILLQQADENFENFSSYAKNEKREISETEKEKSSAKKEKSSAEKESGPCPNEEKLEQSEQISFTTDGKTGNQAPNVPTAEIVKAEYGDNAINQIISAITDVHGICDGAINEQRRFGYLLKKKIEKIKGFDGDFYKFIRFICENSSVYHVTKTTSPKHIYYHLAALISAIKKEISNHHNNHLSKNRIG